MEAKYLKVDNGIWRYKGLSKMKTKELAFEHLVFLLLDWWKEQNPDKEVYENNLGVLKVLKMMFFVSAVNANNIEDKDTLLEVFDNWVAMPYGHIEEDVYKLIRDKEGQFSYFKITNRRIILQKVPDNLQFANHE